MRHHRPATPTAFLLTLIAALAAPPATAAEAPPPIDIELSRQQSINHSKGPARPEGYVIDRGLSAYVLALMPGFEQAVERLGPQDRWLDVGAGRGQAMIDYHLPQAEGTAPRKPQRRRANTVAMSIEDRREQLWHDTALLQESGQMRYVYGRNLRAYSTEEIGGPFQLVSDVIGGFSYTEELSGFVEKVLSLMTVDGVFYTVLQDVRSEEGDNKPFYPNEPFLTRILDEKGAETSVCAWLRRIQCAEVLCAPKSGWRPPLQTYRIRKTCEAVSVPRLERLRYVAGTPPERVFRMTPAPAVPR
jgi:hypothetical protein